MEMGRSLTPAHVFRYRHLWLLVSTHYPEVNGMNGLSERISAAVKRSFFDRFVMFFLCPKVAELWHPESPGMKVTVTRTWIGRMCKPSAFATLSEALRAGVYWDGMNDEVHCPVCGYYCLGKGGVGCIDKPKLCGVPLKWGHTPPTEEPKT